MRSQAGVGWGGFAGILHLAEDKRAAPFADRASQHLLVEATQSAYLQALRETGATGLEPAVKRSRKVHQFAQSKSAPLPAVWESGRLLAGREGRSCGVEFRGERR